MEQLTVISVEGVQLPRLKCTSSNPPACKIRHGLPAQPSLVLVLVSVHQTTGQDFGCLFHLSRPTLDFLSFSYPGCPARERASISHQSPLSVTAFSRHHAVTPGLRKHVWVTPRSGCSLSLSKRRPPAACWRCTASRQRRIIHPGLRPS